MLPPSDGKQVVRIDALRVLAGVMNLFPIWNGAEEHLVGHTMRVDPAAATDKRVAVAADGLVPFPSPALVGVVHPDSPEKGVQHHAQNHVTSLNRVVPPIVTCCFQNPQP